MKISKKHLTIKMQQVSALLLVMLFLSISAVQLFHEHEDHITTRQSRDRQSIDHTDHCLLCDYYAHHLGKQIALHYNCPLSIPFFRYTDLGTLIFEDNHSSLAKSFTNRGPPTSLS